MSSAQELLPSRAEGNTQLASVKAASDTVLSQTAMSGQQQVRRQLETLTFDWQRYCSRLADAEDGLTSALQVRE